MQAGLFSNLATARLDILFIYPFDQEKKLLKYPSISICKQYAFYDYLYLNEEKDDINKVAKDLYGNVWFHQDQFYFLTHPGIKYMTFPCTTTLGGESPGMPCVFPYIFKGIKQVTYERSILILFYVKGASKFMFSKFNHIYLSSESKN